MNLSAPKQIVFIISVILAVIGILIGFGILPAIAGIPAFSWLAVGYLLLAAGNVLNGF